MMQAEYIKVEPFAFKRILTLHMEKGVNSHGGGIIQGYINHEDEEKYSAYPLSTTPVIIRAVSEDGEERIIFYGILTDSNITRENSQRILEIQFTAYTRLMDLTRKNRAFQSPDFTYNDILSHLCKGYEGANFIVQPQLSGIPVQELIVQYQETNWEFLCRLASHFHSIVIADYLTPGVKFYFGLPKRTVIEEIEECEYRLEKSLLSYQYKLQNEVAGISEYDELSVIVRSRSLWEIGDQVLFEGRTYVVCKSVSDLDGHQLYNTYVLMTENGLKIPKSYNEKLIGASVDGIVTGVKSSVVSIQMGIEDVKPSARWYPYATVFSSPDGSGWYCMPQVGDEIRFYFPTRSEKRAYAVSSVHRPAAVASAPAGGGGEKPRSNPAVNELKSPDGKVIQLRDDRIVISNGNGLIISMVDNSGINIVSSGSVNLSAGGDIGIKGSNVTLAGSSSVSIEGSVSSIKLSGEEVKLSGTKVKVQE